MVARQTSSKKKQAAPAPSERVKGETVMPTNTLRLIQVLGVTKAHREIGVSTTTLHKARKNNIVSKVVEIAATAALANLGQSARSQPAQPFTQAAVQDRVAHGNKVVFLISVDRAKEQMVREFARMLDAELVAH